MAGWMWRIGLVSLLAAAGCGGGGAAAPTAGSTTGSGGGEAVLQLDDGNFDALALGGGQPALVEFHSPT